MKVDRLGEVWEWVNTGKIVVVVDVDQIYYDLPVWRTMIIFSTKHNRVGALERLHENWFVSDDPLVNIRKI